MSQEQQQHIVLLNFDRDKEVLRKKTALVLFNRTPEQVKEEELLLV